MHHFNILLEESFHDKTSRNFSEVSDITDMDLGHNRYFHSASCEVLMKTIKV